MTFKQIMVNEKVHRMVRKIAKSYKRSMAAQVEVWAEQECNHPTEKREELTVVDQAAKGQPSRIFVVCGQCRRVLQ